MYHLMDYQCIYDREYEPKFLFKLDWAELIVFFHFHSKIFRFKY